MCTQRQRGDGKLMVQWCVEARHNAIVIIKQTPGAAKIGLSLFGKVLGTA